MEGCHFGWENQWRGHCCQNQWYLWCRLSICLHSFFAWGLFILAKQSFATSCCNVSSQNLSGWWWGHTRQWREHHCQISCSFASQLELSVSNLVTSWTMRPCWYKAHVGLKQLHTLLRRRTSARSLSGDILARSRIHSRSSISTSLTLNCSPAMTLSSNADNAADGNNGSAMYSISISSSSAGAVSHLPSRV